MRSPTQKWAADAGMPHPKTVLMNSDERRKFGQTAGGARARHRYWHDFYPDDSRRQTRLSYMPRLTEEHTQKSFTGGGHSVYFRFVRLVNHASVIWWGLLARRPCWERQFEPGSQIKGEE